jgi:hypothetical protein
MGWIDVLRAADANHQVTSVDRAVALGVSRATFYRSTRPRDGWSAPYPGVRVAPGATGVKTALAAAVAAAPNAVIAGRTATWLRGLRDYPPAVNELVVPHGAWRPVGPKLVVRSARWLRSEDLEEVDGLPTLAIPALVIDACTWSERDLRSVIIDLLHQGAVGLDDIKGRLDGVGPRRGRGRLRELVDDLADRQVESVFHDDVLEALGRRGYRPSLSVTPIETPDGRGLRVDIGLPWSVGVEPEGDRFHRTREQRRSDRRRTAQYAGTDWVPVPVDWRDWQLEPERVFRAIDAAILAQLRRGIGVGEPLPPHLVAASRPGGQGNGE